MHGTVLRGLGFGSSDDPLLCVRATIREADATVDKHVLVGASVSGCAPVSADERDQAPQFSRGRRETGRRQRVSRGKVCSPGRTDAGAGGSVFVEGGKQQAAVGVNVAGVSSGVVGKRVDRSGSADLGGVRTGWRCYQSESGSS